MGVLFSGTLFSQLARILGLVLSVAGLSLACRADEGWLDRWVKPWTRQMTVEYATASFPDVAAAHQLILLTERVQLTELYINSGILVTTVPVKSLSFADGLLLSSLEGVVMLDLKTNFGLLLVQSVDIELVLSDRETGCSGYYQVVRSQTTRYETGFTRVIHVDGCNFEYENIQSRLRDIETSDFFHNQSSKYSPGFVRFTRAEP